MALNEGLVGDITVQTSLEEADDAISFASKSNVLSTRKNIDSAVHKVAHCEVVLFVATSWRDKQQRGKQDTAASGID
jgi:hypothetical protein